MIYGSTAKVRRLRLLQVFAYRLVGQAFIEILKLVTSRRSSRTLIICLFSNVFNGVTVKRLIANMN